MYSVVSSLFPFGDGASGGAVEVAGVDCRSDHVHHRAYSRPKGTDEYTHCCLYLILASQDPTSNPYGLGDGIKYYMLEVEDWTQSSQINKRRPGVRKVSAVSDPENDRKSTSVTPERPPIPPGPPKAEVEESFSITQPPTSRLFPARPRAASTPSAGPSSLSRLLAQASSELFEDATSTVVSPTKVETPTPSASIDREPSTSAQPPAQTQPPPSSSSAVPVEGPLSRSPPSAPPTIGSQPHNASPLRPVSRASRLSTTSRISTARPPTLATVTSSASAVKAVATTALAEPMLTTVPMSSEPVLPGGLPPPSPSESASEGMSQMWMNRRRTASHHVMRGSPLGSGSGAGAEAGQLSHTQGQGQTQAQATPATASSTLATFASNWVVPFGRRKRVETGTGGAAGSEAGVRNGRASYHEGVTSASEMLKRL